MLLIFDCDGVLVDSEWIALEVLADMMSEYDHPMSVDACRDAFMGRHSADIVRGIEERVGRVLPGEGARMRARMLARLERELQPVVGIHAALDRLVHPRCVASSSDHDRIRKTLAWTGLDGCFGENIFSGMDVEHGKPAPDIFLLAAARMGVAPADCLVIEDSEMGVAAGRAARMRVVGFTGGRHTDPTHADRLLAAGAALTVDAMAKLPAVIARMAAPAP